MLIEFDFQDEGHLYADCLFCILTIYCKCLLSQYLNRVILLDNPHRNKGSRVQFGLLVLYFQNLS